MAPVFLFDIDGTLLDSGHAGQKAMEEALRLEFGIDEVTCDISFAGRTDRGIVTDLLTGHGLRSTEEDFARFRQRYFNLLPGYLNSKQGRVLPGVRELLDSLSGRLPDCSQESVGLLTGNFKQSGWMKVRHFKLEHHFSFGVFGDGHYHRDDMAREAADCLARQGLIDSDSVWIIGDTPADVQCARAIGANCLAVASGIYSRKELESSRPDALVDNFEDPDRILDILLGEAR